MNNSVGAGPGSCELIVVLIGVIVINKDQVFWRVDGEVKTGAFLLSDVLVVVLSKASIPRA